jgi:SAM-dependent methyltransferase
VGTAEAADRALFDRIAHDYVRKDLTECCRVARELRLRQTLKPVGERVGRVLEVGCGGGFSARYLEGAYDTYTGVDYSEELIRYAREVNGGPGREFVCANVKDFEAKHAYDVILMVGVLHHMPEPELALVRLRSLLAAGGALVVNEPQRGNPGVSALRWLRKRVDPKYSADQVEFSEREILGLFERTGYRARGVPQGVLSTPFAETRPFPEAMSLALARAASFVDPALDRLLRAPLLRRFAWNVIVVGTPA